MPTKRLSSAGRSTRIPRPTPARRRPAGREILFVAAIYVFYGLTRLIDAGRPSTSSANARNLLRLEQWAHLAPESGLNQFVTARPGLAIPADYAYATLHYAITLAVLIWLWRAQPDAYVAARRTLTATTLLGLMAFATFPLAPPRMLPGFDDTMAHYAGFGWWGNEASAPKGLGALTNQYAAMPSLHVAWAAWCAWQVSKHASRQALRLPAIAYPVFTILVVMSTANHYLADAAAGLMVLVLGHSLSVGAAAVGRGASRIRSREPATREPLPAVRALPIPAAAIAGRGDQARSGAVPERCHG